MSPIPLGILAAAGSKAIVPAMELISTTVLGGATASVTFSGPWSAYTHLQLRVTVRKASAATTGGVDYSMRLNGSAVANQSSHSLSGDGASVTSWAQSGYNHLLFPLMAPGANATAGIFGAGIIDIPDINSTTKAKMIRFFGGHNSNGNRRVSLISGQAESVTAALSSITFRDEVGDSFAAGSRFSLYGIKG